MLDNFFYVPMYFATIIGDCCRVILSAMQMVVFIFLDVGFNEIGIMFFISIAISFIFVAIKFIRSVVW